MPTSHDRSAARRVLIRQLLAEREISSQTELTRLLVDAGHRVSQATVSRDLVELGAVKRSGIGGRDIYVVENRTPTTVDRTEHLRRVLGDFLVSAVPAGNLVVLKVREATAGAVAAALDGVAPEGVLGTVAGDDTVLVIADESVGGGQVAADLLKILE